MSDNVFRKKSLEELDKHDELNAYLKVARPTIWISLSLILIILIGILTWGFLGKIEVKVIGAAEVKNNVLTNYIRKDSFKDVKENQTIKFNDKICTIISIDNPIQVTKDFNEYLKQKGEFLIGEYVYPCKANIECEDGYYITETITDIVAPLSYVFR